FAREICANTCSVVSGRLNMINATGVFSRQSDIQYPSEVRNGFLQTIVQIDPRLPAKLPPCKLDLRLSLPRIVFGQAREDQFGARAGQLNDRLRQSQHRELPGVAHIYRASEIRGAIHHFDDTIDEIVNVTEAAGLLTITINRDVLSPQRLHDEIADDAPIVRAHAGAVGIEDSHHFYL